MASQVQEMRREIERLEKRLEAAKGSLGKLASFIRPGMPVWYEASPGRRHAAVVAGEPRELGEGQIVVALRELDEAYVKENGRNTVKAAATWCLEPRSEAPPDAVRSTIDLEHERDQLRAMLRKVLASAVPNPKEHPTMHAAWTEAKALLGEPRSVREAALAAAGPGDTVVSGKAGKVEHVDTIAEVHEAHRILLQRRAADLLGEWRNVIERDDLPRSNNAVIVVKTRQLLEDVAGLEDGGRGERTDQLWAAVKELRKAVYCLSLELPREVYRDIDRRVEAVIGLIPYAPMPLLGPPLKITEEDGVHKGWYSVKPNNLPELHAFVDTLCRAYVHDVATVAHAMAAAALAAARTIAREMEPRMGKITGGFAGFVPIIFTRHFMNIEGPFGLRLYGDMLYPKNVDKFRNTINLDTFRWLQEKAKDNLARAEAGTFELNAPIDPEVIAHWKRIADGEVPFGFQIGG